MFDDMIKLYFDKKTVLDTYQSAVKFDTKGVMPQMISSCLVQIKREKGIIRVDRLKDKNEKQRREEKMRSKSE